jgi:glutamate--cysteine ligase
MPSFYRFPQPDGSYVEERVTISSQLLIDTATADDCTVEIIEGTRLIRISKDGKSTMLYTQVPQQTTAIGAFAADDKAMCRSLLIHAGLQVPRGFCIRHSQTQKQRLDVFHALNQPLVVKPTHGNKGESVFMNITQESEFLQAVAACLLYHPSNDSGVVVEEQFVGKEYRILATRTEVLAVVNRIPANVVGDGNHSIQQLIDQKNADPRRHDPNGGLFQITIDEMVQTSLRDRKLHLNFVPALDKQIFLRSNSNISTGGDSIDMTDETHESAKEIAVQAVNALPGLAFAGVDLMTTNIMAQQTASSYVLIELNKSPGFFLHELPYEGKKRPVSKALLKLMFS